MDGGNPIALQHILGHKDMDMVKEYVRLFQKDTAILYHGKSPIDQLKSS
ncbi:hypothetical protein N752_01585 [Desulforamulus aquiferis]|nr:hypothetical protein N752_01585 [Desulforamulus aquiferis]